MVMPALAAIAAVPAIAHVPKPTYQGERSITALLTTLGGLIAIIGAIHSTARASGGVVHRNACIFFAFAGTTAALHKAGMCCTMYILDTSEVSHNVSLHFV